MNEPKTIPSNGKRRAISNIAIAVLWNVCVFSVIFFAGDELLKILKEDPIFWLFILFPLVGIFLLYQSAGSVMDWLTFGEAPLTLNAYPVYVGGSLNGFVDIDLDTSNKDDLNAAVSLCCSRHYIDRSNHDDNTRVEVLWQDDVVTPTQSLGGKTKVLFSFNIDDGLPQTQGQDNERHEWVVVVKLPVAGKEFLRSYVVSVDKYYPIEGAAKAPDPLQGSVSTRSEASVETTRSIVKKAHSIPQISDSDDGQKYVYPSSRHKLLGFLFLFASAFFGAVTAGLWSVFSDFLPTVSILFSIPLMLAVIILLVMGLLAFVHRLEVVIRQQGLTVKHCFPFYTYHGDLNINEIADIEISRSGSMSANGGEASKVWYSLKAIDLDGTETTVGDSLEGSSFAKLIRQKMINDLGDGWQPTEVAKKGGKFQKLKNVNKSPKAKWGQGGIHLMFFLAMAYDLYNKFGPD